MRYAEIWPRYAKYWDTMVINPSRVHEFTDEAQYAIDHKAIYQAISDGSSSKVPWPMIAAIHRRESDGNFSTYLGNGQSLAHRTTEVPENRGPFTGANAFVNGGIDAIKQEGWGSIIDWRLEKQLYYAMLFNGTGYEALHGIPSPYVWGGTNIQRPGKYIGDHRYNSHVMDPQGGVAPLLAMIAKLDPTVTFTRETP